MLYHVHIHPYTPIYIYIYYIYIMGYWGGTYLSISVYLSIIYLSIYIYIYIYIYTHTHFHFWAVIYTSFWYVLLCMVKGFRFVLFNVWFCLTFIDNNFEEVYPKLVWYRANRERVIWVMLVLSNEQILPIII